MEKTLVILDPTLKKGFTSLPNAVLTAPQLSLAAKGLYGLLLMFAWQDNECFPGQERLGTVGNCSERRDVPSGGVVMGVEVAATSEVIPTNEG